MSKHRLVTGAGSGIGRAIAIRLADSQCRLSLLGRNMEALNETAKLCKETGAARVQVEYCDITAKESINKAFANCVEVLGPLNSLIANAGIGGANAAGENDRWGEIMRTNLDGSYHCMRVAHSQMKNAAGAKHIVAISSILARIGVGGYTAYCASKAGLNGLVRAMAMELVEQKIQVNAICPGWVDTAMAWEGVDGFASVLQCSRDEAFEVAMKEVPVRRMTSPGEIAAMVAYLLSDDAFPTTGQCFDINGGARME